jgi:hypothetical protein
LKDEDLRVRDLEKEKTSLAVQVSVSSVVGTLSFGLPAQFVPKLRSLQEKSAIMQLDVSTDSFESIPSPHLLFQLQQKLSDQYEELKCAVSDIAISISKSH